MLRCQAQYQTLCASLFEQRPRNTAKAPPGSVSAATMRPDRSQAPGIFAAYLRMSRTGNRASVCYRTESAA
jgi:hypothetical protein